VNRTYFNLMAEFQAGEIRLIDCCEKYFGIRAPEAKRRALVQKLPVRVYRATDKQKSEWLVSIEDLAEYIDKRKRAADKDFNAMQGLRDAG
jgi:hypothetical protein